MLRVHKIKCKIMKKEKLNFNPQRYQTFTVYKEKKKKRRNKQYA